MIAFFFNHYREATHALVALAVITGLGVLIYFKYYCPRKKRQKPA